MELVGAPSLYANIPIINIKNDVKAEKIKDGTLVYENGELEKKVDNSNQIEKNENTSKEELVNIEEKKEESNEENMKVIELGEPKILVEEKVERLENVKEETAIPTLDILDSEIVDENNQDKDIPEIEELSTINVELEIESENLEPVIDFPEEDDDDDDVTFDDLLKKAEEEEAIQNSEIENEKKSNSSKVVINKKPIRSKKNTKQNKR